MTGMMLTSNGHSSIKYVSLNVKLCGSLANWNLIMFTSCKLYHPSSCVNKLLLHSKGQNDKNLLTQALVLEW